MTYTDGTPDFDDPCTCGHNEWKRIGYNDTGLIWGWQCLHCGYIGDAE